MALEFAIVCVPFVIFLLGIFEMSFALYAQSALDAALQRAAKQVATGNTQNTSSTATFAASYLCPDLQGSLTCGAGDRNLLVSVQKASLSSSNDFYAYTTGTLPLAGNTLTLPASYGSFCNAVPNQALVITVIYLGPTFLGRFLPGLFSEYYGGFGLVHATMSTAGIVTEAFPRKAVAGTPAPAC